MSHDLVGWMPRTRASAYRLGAGQQISGRPGGGNRNSLAVIPVGQ